MFFSTQRTIGGSSSAPNLPDIPEAGISRHPKILHPFPPPRQPLQAADDQSISITQKHAH
ncbi:hypothetical protein N7530_012681 [Penicillium desertorum]|uniref:Uncharacterized protein n=1 Tax=Penicillium desertorum TaxID=1303715 RepID=A0A9X0BFI3_9EURO|nr:hypothetical protein N7530_012681 [Penicillium desertorum]